MKLEALIKRIEYFEKLAVYGNRSAFLKKISQESNIPGYPQTSNFLNSKFPSELKSKIETVVNNLDASAGNKEAKQALINKLDGFLEGTETSLDKLNELVEEVVKLTLFSDVSQFNNVKELSKSVKELMFKPTPMDNITTKNKQLVHPELLRMDAGGQLALGEILHNIGYKYEDNDGLVGPRTEAAIKKYLDLKKISMPSQKLTQEFIDYVSKMAKKELSDINYDNWEKTYERKMEQDKIVNAPVNPNAGQPVKNMSDLSQKT